MAGERDELPGHEELARAVNEAYAEAGLSEAETLSAADAAGGAEPAGGGQQGGPLGESEEAADAEAAPDAAAQAAAQLAQVSDELARSRADLYNLQQEYNAFVRRTRGELTAARVAGAAAVIEALIPVFDDLHLAREHGDLQGPFAAIADKLEATLASQHGFARFGQAGDAFDPTQHEALVAMPHPEVEQDTVHEVLQPGYRAGERVLRPARVAVHTPTE